MDPSGPAQNDSRTMPRPPLRATFDPDVVAAWQALLRDRPQPLRKVYPVLAIAGVLCGLLAFALSAPLWGLAGIGLLICIVGANIAADQRDHRMLRCPHCHQPPVGPWERQSVRRADWCNRCRYWLNPPY